MSLDLLAANSWRPPEAWRRVRTIDAHTGGEPFRVVVAGGPDIPGDTMLAKRRWATEHADDLRRLLMLEPRGHGDMYGCFLTEPVTPEADLGILFMHNAGFSTMCGHGIIAITKVLCDTELLEAKEEVGIDSPAGLIRARPVIDNGTATSVAFTNVPSFVTDLNAQVDVAGFGRVTYDLAFGGAFYAFVDAAALDLELEPHNAGKLTAAGRSIKKAITATRAIDHPTEPDLGFLYGAIFVGPAAESGRHSRHVCVFADGEVDRSPTGTGVSARLAILHRRDELALDEAIDIESIVGSSFTGRVSATSNCDELPAVIPEVRGSAWISGCHDFCLDPADPFPTGFFLR